MKGSSELIMMYVVPGYGLVCGGCNVGWPVKPWNHMPYARRAYIARKVAQRTVLAAMFKHR